jgi:hypothetical protein
MARRVSTSYKNLDDSFKIYNFITLTSTLWVIGILVGAFYLQMVSTRWLGQGVFTLLLGRKGAFAPFFIAGAAALGLHHLEDREDEHYAGAACAYYWTRHYRYVYSGGVSDDAAGQTLRDIVERRRGGASLARR